MRGVHVIHPCADLLIFNVPNWTRVVVIGLPFSDSVIFTSRAWMSELLRANTFSILADKASILIIPTILPEITEICGEARRDIVGIIGA